MSFKEDLGCLLTLSNPNDLLVCFTTLGGVPVWNIIYIGLIVIGIGGWSLTRSINEGLMVGGFIVSLAGLGLFALDLITVQIWLLALLLTITGVIITAIKANNND